MVNGAVPPTGAASGDLSGNYPGPTVVATHLSAALPVAQGGTGNTTGQPSGTASGDLSGSYPSPTLAKVGGSTGSAGQALLSSGSALLFGTPDPGLLVEPAGTLARNMLLHHISAANLSALTTGGVVAVSSIGLPAGISIGHLQVVFGTTPANGPQHLWQALLDSTLHVLAVSTDQLTAPQAASTASKLAVTIDGTNPYVVPAAGLYYVAVSSSATSAAPTLCGVTPVAGSTGLTSGWGTAGTQATPPAVGTQLASGVVSTSGTANFAAWAMT